MGFNSGGILLHRNWVLDPYGLIAAMGVKDWRATPRRVPISTIDHRFEGGALAFYGQWTCVFDYWLVYDALLQARQTPREIETSCLAVAPEALLWICETRGDSYAFIHLTPSTRRVRRFCSGTWELDLGAPLAFEKTLATPLHGETAVQAAIEACLGRHPVDLAKDCRLRATVFK